MHPGIAFRWTDEPAMLAFVSEVAFARIFATTPAGPRVAHAPVMVTPQGRLRFHLANANLLSPHLAGATALALVEGPNAYLSANWYADTRGNVPSWNYVAVECEGPVICLDRAALVAFLDEASAVFEPRVGENWTRAKVDPARFEAMLDAITLYELIPVAMRGTAKLSQNKPEREAERLIAGMARTAPKMASAMRAART